MGEWAPKPGCVFGRGAWKGGDPTFDLSGGVGLGREMVLFSFFCFIFMLCLW